MPDRYEREIDEILRRADDGHRRRRASARRGMPPPLSFPEMCLAIAILAALVGGGWAYANGGGNLLTGLLGLIGAVCIALVALSSFIERNNRSSSSRWR